MGWAGRSPSRADAEDHLVRLAGGDVRKALTALEAAAGSAMAQGSAEIDLATAERAVDVAAVRYDRDGDAHYDVTSAFIKSMRGSDVDAALHWLARMLVAGEDARFIARRMVIFASEDVGMADPAALTVATAAAQAVEYVGLPEAQLNLAQAVIHLATAPKSNSVTTAIGAAMADVRAGRGGPVPRGLRDAHYAGARGLGHGGYRYPHDDQRGVVTQQYVPDDLVGMDYYRPSQHGAERAVAARLPLLRRHVRGCDDVHRRRPGRAAAGERSGRRPPIGQRQAGRRQWQRYAPGRNTSEIARIGPAGGRPGRTADPPAKGRRWGRGRPMPTHRRSRPSVARSSAGSTICVRPSSSAWTSGPGRGSGRRAGGSAPGPGGRRPPAGPSGVEPPVGGPPRRSRRPPDRGASPAPGNGPGRGFPAPRRRDVQPGLRPPPNRTCRGPAPARRRPAGRPVSPGVAPARRRPSRPAPRSGPGRPARAPFRPPGRSVPGGLRRRPAAGRPGRLPATRAGRSRAGRGRRPAAVRRARSLGRPADRPAPGAPWHVDAAGTAR